MSKAKETLLALAHFNSWRRGDNSIEHPGAYAVGATIDDAVNLLRKYDEMERELTRLRGVVGVRGDCKTGESDYSNWLWLTEQADCAKKLRSTIESVISSANDLVQYAREWDSKESNLAADKYEALRHTHLKNHEKQN